MTDRARLLNALQQAPASTVELAKRFGWRTDYVRRHLSELRQLRIVEASGFQRVGRGHQTKVWRLCSQEALAEEKQAA